MLWGARTHSIKSRSTASAQLSAHAHWLQTRRQTPQTGNDSSGRRGRTNGRTDGRYQVHYLPRFAVDKYLNPLDHVVGGQNSWQPASHSQLSKASFFFCSMLLCLVCHRTLPVWISWILPDNQDASPTFTSTQKCGSEYNPFLFLVFFSFSPFFSIILLHLLSNAKTWQGRSWASIALCY